LDDKQKELKIAETKLNRSKAGTSKFYIKFNSSLIFSDGAF